MYLRSSPRWSRPGISIAVHIDYTEDLFGTFNDENDRAVVRKVVTEELSLAGMSVFGLRAEVDAALKGLSPHK